MPRWCAIGIANPIVGDHVRMTNHDWAFSIEAMRQSLGFERFLVINDFTALALALPALAPEDLRQVGAGQRGTAGAARPARPRHRARVCRACCPRAAGSVPFRSTERAAT